MLFNNLRIQPLVLALQTVSADEVRELRTVTLLLETSHPRSDFVMTPVEARWDAIERANEMFGQSVNQSYKP